MFRKRSPEMRINSKHYPIFDFLEDPKNGASLGLPESENYNGGKLKTQMLWENFWGDMSKSVPMYREHIDIVSLPFMQAAHANRMKIMTEETLDELLKEDVYGVFVMGAVVIVYYFHMNEDGMIEDKSIVMDRDHLVSINDGNEEYLVPRDYPEGIDDARSVEHYAMLFHLFKKYADVETVAAVSNKKVAIPNEKDKLLFEFNLKANYTDCSWFREIIRKEGFMVRGHFKLQPYKKDGEWTRKLIYIEPYQKHGYTRRARIEKTIPVQKSA